MSLSFQPLKAVEVRDPRTIIDNQRDYAILKAGSQTTWKQYTTTSVSQSSIQFSCPPPSGGIIVDRKMYFYLPVKLTFTGIPPVGQTLLQANRDAPRAYPIASSIDTFQATINNQSVSINIADIVHAMLHFNTDAKLKNRDYSMTPTCPDQSQQYGDLFDSIRSPLQNYGDSNDESVMGRGGFNYVITANPVSTGVSLTATVEMAVCEPIFLSPFYWGMSNESGFFNVNTMDFNLTFLGTAANRMWSHDDIGGTNVITSASVTFGGLTGGPTSFANGLGNQPLMLFNYITPQETQVLSPNMAISYPYFDVQRYPTDYGSAVTAGSMVTMNSNNIQLSSIPRRLYIYIRERNNDLYSNPSHTDTFFQINQITVQWQNKNGLLASASPLQLYEMSLKNHCNMSWTQWYGGPVYKPGSVSSTMGTIGSIVCIEFATDIGLDSLDAPGKLSQSMLQVSVNAVNVSNHSISPTLYIVPVLEGTFTIEGLGRASTNIGVISSQDILDAKSSPFVNYKDVEHVNGGNFLSGLKDFGRKLYTGLRESKAISNILGAIPNQYTQIAAPIARSLGFGEGEGNWPDDYAGHRRAALKGWKHGHGNGEGVSVGGEGVSVGGEGISRSSLKKRLRF